MPKFIPTKMIDNVTSNCGSESNGCSSIVITLILIAVMIAFFIYLYTAKKNDDKKD